MEILITLHSILMRSFLVINILICGNFLATENQQAIINDVIDVKMGVYLHKT